MLTQEQNDMEALLKQLPVLNEYFQLHNKIGQGTFSTVYLATLRNSSSTQKYAVKHLTQACEQSKIQNEFRCLQEIGGKDNVVPAELCLTNGNNCVTFIMPYLPHPRFSDYVVDMDVEETRLYMKNLLIALRRVHSFNIIHRDVKPNNFLYNRETKQFLLVDFGLAQLVGAPNQSFQQEKISIDENLPIDYSKKRKRALDSSEGNKKTPLKANKRIALKSKDNNVKISSPAKTNIEAKIQNDKTPLTTREEEGLKSPIKQWANKKDTDTTPLKSGSFSPASLPSSSRRKLIDFQEVGTPSKSPLGVEPLKTSIGHSSKLLRENSFTPLVSSPSSNASFVQVRNSRVVRHATMSSISKLDALPKKALATASFSQSCPCSGKGAICCICSSRQRMFAPRAGTSGFRPPEVLFRYLHQTTAVDIWAAGVVMLCILSGCYPFFNSSSDLVSLAEIMTIFGTERTIKVAHKFGRRILCSERRKGVDLKKLCTRLRARSTRTSRKEKFISNEPKCRECFQAIRNDGCLCFSDETSSDSNNASETDFKCPFPDSAFDLLYRLLDLDPTTRITAVEALEHPFITGV